MDEKKKEADSVSHFSAERIFGFWGQEKATEIPLTGTCSQSARRMAPPRRSIERKRRAG